MVMFEIFFIVYCPHKTTTTPPLNESTEWWWWWNKQKKKEDKMTIRHSVVRRETLKKTNDDHSPYFDSWIWSDMDGHSEIAMKKFRNKIMMNMKEKKIIIIECIQHACMYEHWNSLYMNPFWSSHLWECDPKRIYGPVIYLFKLLLLFRIIHSFFVVVVVYENNVNDF